MKICTFNVGYNVMANKMQGSEASQVKLCRATKTNCFSNEAKFISKFDLFGLQEVNENFRVEFEAEIKKSNPRAQFVFTSFHYFGDYAITIGFNRAVTGDAVDVFSSRFPLKPKTSDIRAIQAIYFETIDLLMINLHAPHQINLKAEIELACKEIEKNAKKDLTELKIVITGDFNDDIGRIASYPPKHEIQALGHSLKIPGGKLLKSCCTDADFTLPGDYILVNKNVSVEYYGFPIGYERGKPQMSDHDPIELIVIDLQIDLFDAIVVKSGTYVELRLLDIDADRLLTIAKEYVTRKKLKWNVRKPYAWTDYDSGPHVSLRPEYSKLVGKKFKVKVIWKPHHFIDGTTRWIVLPVEIPTNLKCKYECHLSIGQERT